MVIDTSALLAILLNEPERHVFNEKISLDPVRLLSAANYLEAAIILEDRLGTAGVHQLQAFLSEASVEVVPVTFGQVEIAREAYKRFGRGNHEAELNYGDTFAYSLARERGETLLYKGSDFPQTDIRAA